ncbi:MAG: transcription initiation factor IIB [Candidatus Nitrosotalea sp.]|nr:transcription initiation factor IIB [Candidatus Nitrosotalea sp.]
MVYQDIKKCTNENCTKGLVVTDDQSGEILCSSCGLILDEKTTISGPEQQAFTSEEYFEKSRTGTKTSLAINDMGLSTIIGKANRDASGCSLSGNMKQTFDRLRMWDSRSKSKSCKTNMKSAFILIDTVQTKLAIPDAVIEEAAYLYRKVKAKKARGCGIDCLALASLYLSCRMANAPRTIPDIASAGNVSIKDLSRHVRILITNLDLKVESYNSSDFVTRVGSTIGASEKSCRDALTILAKTRETGYSEGKNPIALTASALYVSCTINGERFTQKEIAKAAGISNVSLRLRSESILKTFNIRDLLNM